MKIQHLINGAAVASAQYFETVNPPPRGAGRSRARGEREWMRRCGRQGGVSGLAGRPRPNAQRCCESWAT